MIIGFTGTQKGMSYLQKKEVTKILSHMDVTVLHHGDCIGADSDVHVLAGRKGIPVTIHPPTYAAKRAYCDCREGDDLLQPKPYIERNHDIVDTADILIATPGERKEVLRSGTWATIRYAVKNGVTVCIVYPDGYQEFR